jgi:hypothetical protein
MEQKDKRNAPSTRKPTQKEKKAKATILNPRVP